MGSVRRTPLTGYACPKFFVRFAGTASFLPTSEDRARYRLRKICDHAHCGDSSLRAFRQRTSNPEYLPW